MVKCGGLQDFKSCFTSYLLCGLDLNSLCIIFFKKKRFLKIYFKEGKGERKERNLSVWLPLLRLPLGTWPTTQACALTGNGTDDPLVCRPALSPLSHTNQGSISFLLCKGGEKTIVTSLGRE